MPWKHAIISIIKRFTNQELNLQIEIEIPSVYIQFHSWSAAAYSNKSHSQFFSQLYPINKVTIIELIKPQRETIISNHESHDSYNILTQPENKQEKPKRWGSDAPGKLKPQTARCWKHTNQPHKLMQNQPKPNHGINNQIQKIYIYTLIEIKRKLCNQVHKRKTVQNHTIPTVDADAWSCPFLSSKLSCNLYISSSIFLASASA